MTGSGDLAAIQRNREEAADRWLHAPKVAKALDAYYVALMDYAKELNESAR